MIVSKSSYFLGDPPPDPRFLASLGVLSLVDLPFMERTLLSTHFTMTPVPDSAVTYLPVLIVRDLDRFARASL
jgi:hypothetical protein